MKKAAIYTIHTIYWAFYFGIVSFIVIVMMKFQNNFSLEFYFKLTFNSPFVILVFVSALMGFYIHATFLFTKYYLTRKISRLILFSLLYSILAALLCAAMIYLVFGHKGLFNDGSVSFAGITMAMAVISVFHGIAGLVIRGFINGYADIRIKEELSRKNFETELALIKSKINPHFLFNTINNIDVLIQKNQVLASEYLNKLSEMLRFSLYETDAPAIPLYKELEYIEKYIELQKIRTSNPNYITYVKTGEPSNKYIAPMLFIPFIENAFKHLENVKSAGNISIKFELMNEAILFACSNSYLAGIERADYKIGIGNELIKKRIELLYPNKHFLEIIISPSLYTVKLKINLA